MKRLLAAAGVTAASFGLMVLGVGPARADESSYLADLSARGIPVLSQPAAVSDGFRVCSEIRAGESPQTAAGSFGPYYNVVGPQIVDIAQRNLCPDTLH